MVEGKGSYNKMGDEKDRWEEGGREKGELKRGTLGEGWMGERGKVAGLSGGCVLSELCSGEPPRAL